MRSKKALKKRKEKKGDGKAKFKRAFQAPARTQVSPLFINYLPQRKNSMSSTTGVVERARRASAKLRNRAEKMSSCLSLFAAGGLLAFVLAFLLPAEPLSPEL